LKYILPTVVCFLLSFSVWRQKTEQEKDSIKKYFKITKSSFRKYQYKESIEAANKGITYAKQINDLNSLAEFHNDLGLE